MTAKFYVYRNLNTGGFSIKHKGLVVARPESFVVFHPTFQISEKGQSRARKNKKRNVHAYIVSDNWHNYDRHETDERYFSNNAGTVFYNPFETDTFVDKKTGKELVQADAVYFIDGKAYYI